MLQHSGEAAHVEPLPLHTGTPASGVPASRAVWQTPPRHEAPPQQAVMPPSLAAPQLSPIGAQPFPPEQKKPAPPSALGRHGEAPQHWSLNWHAPPPAIQQGATPVYPVGQLADLPPKQRG